MLTEVQILDRAEGFADRFDNRADGDKWLERVTSYRLGAMWAKDQSEKELATLRAELDAKTAAFEGLKKLLGTKQDATTQHMENQVLRA